MPMEIANNHGNYTANYVDTAKKPDSKAAERRAERKEQMDKLTEDGEAEWFTISTTGTDVKSVTQNLIAAVSGTSALTGVSFDIKA